MLIKKKISLTLQKVSIVLLVLTLCISTLSLSIPSAFIENKTSTINNNDQKITQILNIIDEDLVFEYLKTLVGFGPRMTGTYGCEKAAEYIYDQFIGMGLDTQFHDWAAWGNRRYPHFYESQNIIATHPGEDPNSATIIFNAHYDTVTNSPGANDDGSGTAAVLAAAYALSQFEFQQTIKFITFSGEEIALLGSRAYAKESYQKNDRILVQINADMIGYDEGSKKMRVTASEDVVWVSDIFKIISETYPIGLNVTQGRINRIQHGLRGSDYASFLLYGYECIACWQVDWDGNMHTPQDDITNVNMSYLVNTTRLIAATLAHLADTTEYPPQVRITSPQIGFFYRDGIQKREIGEYKTMVLNDIWIWAEVDYVSAPLLRAEFYYNGRLVHVDTEEPFKWHFNKRALGNKEIEVIVYDILGRNTTDWREIFFINLFPRI
ncbi:MAG: M20/M25/M40 family metallo-hydrolase [Thermoplasmatota archaeon]